MTSIKNLKNELGMASDIKESALRGVEIASVIADALRSIGQDPILVGGAAVEFYTQGGYSTKDIDMLAPGGPELFQRMDELGFERLGKDFVQKDFKIFVEFPGSGLGPNEQADRVQVGKRSLRIISMTDLIVDRLCSYKFWKSGIDGANALLLMELGEADEGRLQQRAKEEDVLDALNLLEETREEIIRKKLSREEANRLLERGMRKLK